MKAVEVALLSGLNNLVIKSFRSIGFPSVFIPDVGNVAKGDVAPLEVVHP